MCLLYCCNKRQKTETILLMSKVPPTYKPYLITVLIKIYIKLYLYAKAKCTLNIF